MQRAFITYILDIIASAGVHAQLSHDGRMRVDVGGNGKGIGIGITVGAVVKELMTIECSVKSVKESADIHDVAYRMSVGKRLECRNSYRSVEYVLESGDTLLLRVYNDGVAWKSPYPTKIRVINPENCWLQRWTDCYEEFFPKNPAIASGSRWAYPALFEYSGGVFALLTESGIDRGCAAASMTALPDAHGFMLAADGDGETGWQTLIAGSLSDVVESTLVSDNSAPCRVADCSWIEPGVASWVYWAYNHGSNDYGIIKKYVDMAADLSLPYVLIDAEWDEMRDGKTVEDAVAYAIGRGVKPMIWYNSSVGWVNGAPGPKYRLNTPDDREREFAWCERMGVAGVKIDFFSGDTRENINYMTDLMEAAASHRLLVNFHGATLPRGWQRTYPNLVSTEAVYGAEWYNNVPTFTDKAASHNATLPFTRNVVGSMDYTPCAFSDSQHPHITTHAHELALTVLFESGIQHLADRPESIMAQPEEVRRFFTSLPTTWDDTLLLDGYPGEYVLMARRKGERWYIAAINGSDTPMTLNNPNYSRLKPAATAGRILMLADGGEPNSWDISSLPEFPQTITMKPRGGVVMIAE